MRDCAAGAAGMNRANPLLPALFVLLWSTGFIAAKYGLPYAPPLKFLLVRFALVTALMTVVALVTRARWPGGGRQIAHIAVAASLVHGLYLGGVFVALAGGMPAGIARRVASVAIETAGHAGASRDFDDRAGRPADGADGDARDTARPRGHQLNDEPR